LLQLLPPDIFASNTVSGVNWRISCVEITDSPRFPWRGFMLDVARNFFTRQEVEKLLNAMALHKLNVLHLHLTDDQGWRIEIKKYPKLTPSGADGRHGDFYTRDDIRELVAYAAARHITVVPEIETPGHSGAALRAYPEFTCAGKPGANVYCPGRDETFDFLRDVLTEVMALFPSKRIHIGGDEVNKESWKTCERCQARIKAEGLKNEEALQGYFINRMGKMIGANGRAFIGWSEILRGDLPQNAVGMDWRGGGREAATAGQDVVMTPASHCYLDYYQSRDHSVEPYANGICLSVEHVYSFEPIPAGLAADKQRHILGVQGNLWTKSVPNLKHAEYMAFPRLTALAEVAWSPKESRNYEDFKRRLKMDELRLDRLGVNYRNSSLDDGASTIGVQVGGWKSNQIKAEFAPLEWDVTKQVTASGKVQVNVQVYRKNPGVRIAWVALLEDGKEISRDEHAAVFDRRRSSPVARYTLEAPAPKTGATYTLRAQLAGKSEKGQTGSVFWLYGLGGK